MQRTEVYLKSLSAGGEEDDQNTESPGPLPHKIIFEARMRVEISWIRAAAPFNLESACIANF